MSERKVTIQDIADKMGVSKSTVSKAMSGSSDINEKTREKILRCAGELGYIIGRERTLKESSVAIFIYGIFFENLNQFGYEIILGIRAAANDSGIGINLIPVDDIQVSTGSYFSLIEGKDYMGCFFLGFKPHPDFIKKTEGMNLPMVILDNDAESPLAARVGSDNMGGISQIINYLYDKGHRKIGFLGGEKDSIVTKEREEYYEKALEELELEPPSGCVKYGHFSGEDTWHLVNDIAAAGATAIVCISDTLACCAVRELIKAGYKVPEDISVTGFDDLPEAQQCVPPITTIKQNRLHIGKLAYNMMTQIKAGIHISAIYLQTELVERGSVAECRLTDEEADAQKGIS